MKKTPLIMTDNPLPSPHVHYITSRSQPCGSAALPLPINEVHFLYIYILYTHTHVHTHTHTHACARVCVSEPISSTLPWHLLSFSRRLQIERSRYGTQQCHEIRYFYGYSSSLETRPCANLHKALASTGNHNR